MAVVEEDGMRIVVTGAGIAGLSTAIAGGRRGHDVLVCERDEHPAPAPASAAFEAWVRRGIGHFRQPHTFLPLARKTLIDEAPDIMERLAAAGAGEFDQASLLSFGEATPADDELRVILCRRPVFEAVLREVAGETPGVRLARGVVVEGLVARQRGRMVEVGGVQTASGMIDADLVVDASGRTSRTYRWLEAAGAELPGREERDCGIVYFSRHFRFRPGVEQPGATTIFGGPRGDLGYLLFVVIIGDARTFSVVLATRPEDVDFKALRDGDAFLAAARRIPGLGQWVDPDVAEPVTPVLFMGRLANTLQPLHAAPGTLRGIRTVGDAFSHVNPTVALGAAVSLVHGFAVGALLEQHTDVGDLSEAFEAAQLPEARARFDAVSAEDRDRMRWWRGELLDPHDPNQSLALAIRSAVYPAATRDPEVFRAVARRIGALDPIGVLPANRLLVERALRIFADLRARGAAPAPGCPPREELAEAMAEATWLRRPVMAAAS
jgi:2-polyprenyl-6-methoxyphenol hydroxylase-like FAD-dependent oxidoreductase